MMGTAGRTLRADREPSVTEAVALVFVGTPIPRSYERLPKARHDGANRQLRFPHPSRTLRETVRPIAEFGTGATDRRSRTSLERQACLSVVPEIYRPRKQRR